MLMKKLLGFALACTFVIGLMGCGKENSSTGNMVDKDGYVYANVRVEGDSAICEGYAPYTMEEKYYSATNHKIWEVYREDIDSVKIGGKYIESVSNHYTVYEPFDIPSLEWITFEFTAVKEDEWDSFRSKYELYDASKVGHDGCKGGSLTLYSVRGCYSIYFRSLYIDEKFISRCFSDTTVDRIGLGVIAEFKEGTSEEDALEAMRKIGSYIEDFDRNSDADSDK